MKNERMCNIVKDLLPLYIDDLCSEDSKQMVEEHIKGCDECKRALELMKDGESEVATNFSRMDETDEQLMKRVSKDINKKTKRFKKISIACLGMVVVLLFGLFAPVVSVSSQEFKVSVENFDKSQCSIDDQAEVIENFEEDTIFLNDPDETNDSEKYRRIIIPFGEAMATIKETIIRINNVIARPV